MSILDAFGVDGAILVSAFTMYRYDANYALERRHAPCVDDDGSPSRVASMSAVASTPEAQHRPKVFVSYSRKDLHAAEHVRARLIERGFDAFLDNYEILPGEPWEDRIGTLIERSDSVVFLVSPDSLASSICDWEVNEAERLGKRIVPVVLRDQGLERAPGRLKRLNFIFMLTAAMQQQALEQLAFALLTDIAWIREHTRLGELTGRWQAQGGGDNHELLRGQAITDAELWISSRPTSAPEPTVMQRAFVQQSRVSESARAARSRRLQTRAAWAIGLVGMLSLAGVVAAIWEDIATTRREQAVFATLAEQAIEQGHHDRAIRLALIAYPAPGAWPWAPHSPQLQAKLAGASMRMRLRRSFGGHGGTVRAVAISEDGRHVIAGSDDRTARIWDVESGQQVMQLTGHSGPVTSVGFSADSRRAVTGSSDGSARVWNIEKGQALLVLRHSSGVSAQFSPDGSKLLVHGSDAIARVWDLSTRERAAEFKDAIATAFDRETGHLLVAHRDGSTQWARPDSGTAAVVSPGPAVEARRVLRAEGRHLLVALGDGLLRVTDARDGTQRSVDVGYRRAEDGRWSGLTAAAVSLDGKLLAVAQEDESVQISALESGRRIMHLKGHERVHSRFNEGIAAIAFSADGKLLVTGSHDRTVRIWDVRVGRELVHGLPGTGGQSAIELSANGKTTVAIPVAGSITEWSPDPRDRLGKPRSDADWTDWKDVASSFVTAGMRRYSEADEHELRVLEIGSQRLVTTIKEKAATATGFSTDGKRIVTGSDEGSAGIWSVESGALIARLRNHEITIYDASFSRDGQRVVTASGDGTARVSDAGSGQEISHFNVSTREVRVAALSPDGRRLVTGAMDRAVRLWDVDSGSGRLLFATSEGPLFGATFSPDGRRVVTVAFDKSIRLWDAESGAEIAMLSAEHGDSDLAIWSANGRHILTHSRDRRLGLWDVSWAMTYGEALRQQVCTRRLIGSDQLLTEEELMLPVLSSIDRGDIISRNPCLRRGPLAFAYWTSLARRAWYGRSGEPGKTPQAR